MIVMIRMRGSNNDEMALFVRRFGKYMKKRGFGGRRRGQSSSWRLKEYQRCYNHRG